MNRFKIFFLLIVLIITSIKCSDNDLEVDQTPAANLEVQNFIWKGMNSWYNWQSNVADLADSKPNNQDNYLSYLKTYSNPEDLFKSLLYNPNITDRFSWFIEDYDEQIKAFQGILVSTGIRRSDPIGIGDNQVVIYAQHVSLESPAYIAGMRRGDIINAIDGEVMNESNYISVINKLYNGKTVLVSTVKEENGVLVKLKDFSITPIEFPDDPVYFKSIFNDINGKKVGYLVYNGFRATYNDELNTAFNYFKSEGINELVLDLRLNGGGSVETSAYLASMIIASASLETFAKLTFNSKHSKENGTYTFQNKLNIYKLLDDGKVIKTGEEAINRLTSINQIYILTSSSTASASEMVINGLKPFIPVKVIGTKTYGKNVGSITLYNSTSSVFTTDINSANPAHFNAMQPIVFQIFNKNNESDYIQGFIPDIEVKEWRYWNSILPFGDQNEVVLKTALDKIRGISSKSVKSDKSDRLMKSDVLDIENKFEKEMYIDRTFLNQ